MRRFSAFAEGRKLLLLLLLVPIAALLVAHSLYFDFVSDDAYISFVYARNLAEHGELVFNLGDRVEGYTNFLWTVLLGVLLELGVQPELSSRVIGTALGIATLALTVGCSRLWWSGRTTSPVVVVVVDGTASCVALSPWDYLPAMLLAISSGFACWCSGGLETQLFTFLVILGIHAYLADSLVFAGVALALAALTRPEGCLVLAATVGHRVAVSLIREHRLLPRRQELLMIGAFCAIYLPFFAWRWWYYGWPFPNTFYVKVGGPQSPQYARQVLANGAYYVWQWATQSRALLAIPLAIVAFWRAPRVCSYLLLLSAAYLAYVANIGGDFMGLHRFVMPLFVTTALLSTLGLRQLAGWWLSRSSARPWSAVVPAAAACLLLGAFAWSQARLSKKSLVPVADRGIDRPGYLKLYAHDRELIGRALAPRLRPDDFSIVGGAGVQPYVARMRAIDVFGLVSETIAHEVPPTNPRPGHQKWAPASLLLRYSPTFVFHCYDIHRSPSSYRLCGEARTFEENGYEPVTIHVPGLRERGEYYTFLKRRDRDWQ
ncbi:MAG: hypothetical protein V2A73_05905 [Pseudomonadota bacterium]